MVFKFSSARDYLRSLNWQMQGDLAGSAEDEGQLPAAEEQTSDFGFINTARKDSSVKSHFHRLFLHNVDFLQ